MKKWSTRQKARKHTINFDKKLLVTHYYGKLLVTHYLTVFLKVNDENTLSATERTERIENRRTNAQGNVHRSTYHTKNHKKLWIRTNQRTRSRARFARHQKHTKNKRLLTNLQKRLLLLPLTTGTQTNAHSHVHRLTSNTKKKTKNNSKQNKRTRSRASFARIDRKHFSENQRKREHTTSEKLEKSTQNGKDSCHLKTRMWVNRFGKTHGKKPNYSTNYLAH